MAKSIFLLVFMVVLFSGCERAINSTTSVTHEALSGEWHLGRMIDSLDTSEYVRVAGNLTGFMGQEGSVNYYCQAGKHLIFMLDNDAMFGKFSPGEADIHVKVDDSPVLEAKGNIHSSKKVMLFEADSVSKMRDLFLDGSKARIRVIQALKNHTEKQTLVLGIKGFDAASQWVEAGCVMNAEQTTPQTAVQT